jgi:1-acyl-sn-glycerol-3-phosphate acyltransferase
MNNVWLKLRGIWRVLRIILHLLGGVCTIIFVYPLASRLYRLALKQRWSQRAVKMLGVRLQVKGQLAAHMRVSNHISWLDVIIINSIIPSVFIAKDDLRHWPIMGWLSKHTETYFMQRGSRSAAHKAAQYAANLLRDNIDVLVFPEGTTSDGSQVLPFYNALLQGAIDTAAPVQPIAIRYCDAKGNLSQSPVFCGEINFIESLWRIVCADYLIATIHILPPINSLNKERRGLTNQLRDSITAHLLG